MLPNVPNVAPGYAAPANAPLPTGDLVGVNQPFVGINLQDAITMALQRNTDLAVAESNNRIANYQIVAAKGAYDVQFQLQPSYYALGAAGDIALPSRTQRRPDHADLRRRLRRVHGDDVERRPL